MYRQINYWPKGGPRPRSRVHWLTGPDGKLVAVPKGRAPDRRVKPTKRHNGPVSVLSDEEKAAAVARSVPLSKLYVIGAAGHPMKIGYAENPGSRLTALQIGNPASLRIYSERAVPADRARALEQEVHDRLGDFRIRGEWFDITPLKAVEVIDLVLHLAKV